MMESNKIRLQALEYDDCIRYKNILTTFYYENSITCSHLEHFSKIDAEAKINSMMEHIQDGSAIVFGAIVGDELVGYIWAYEHQFREETGIYINEIYVEESYRGKGIGRKLLRAVEKAAMDNGYNSLYLHTEGGNRRAIRLYESEDYVIERIQFRKNLWHN